MIELTHSRTDTVTVTPPAIAAEIREDTNGLLRRRAIDAAGVETWVIA